MADLLPRRHCNRVPELIGPTAILLLMLVLPAAIFAVLLVATGAAKAVRPTDTARAIRQIGIPAGVFLVRVLAAAEIGVGVAVLVTTSPVALWLQTGLYSVFAGWVWVALAKDVPMSSCGCLGRADTPPYWGHIVVNVAAVLFSAGGAIAGGVWLTGGGLESAASLVIVGVGAGLAWQVLGEGARVSALLES